MEKYVDTVRAGKNTKTLTAACPAGAGKRASTKEPVRWIAGIFVILLLNVILLPGSEKIYAAVHEIDFSTFLKAGAAEKNYVADGKVVSFLLDDICTLAEPLMEAYMNGDIQRVEYQDPMDKSFKPLTPDYSSLCSWDVPDGTAGKQTCFRLILANGDIYKSKTYVIKDGASYCVGTKVVDLRNGPVKMTGSVSAPASFSPEYLALAIYDTIASAAEYDHTFYKPPMFYHDDMYVVDFDLNNDGKADLHYEEDAMLGEYSILSRLSTSSVPGAYTIRLSNAAKQAEETQKRVYFENLTLLFPKGANPMSVKPKTASVNFKKLQKKNQTLKVSKVLDFKKKGQGTITYIKLSGNKKIKIDKKTGKVTVKKGLKKNTYKVKVKIKAAGNDNYLPGEVKVTYKVKVK